MERKVTEVVAALIWDGNEFMICQRPANKARGMLWEFVGGKVEPDETKQQALIRILVYHSHKFLTYRKRNTQFLFTLPD